MGTKKATGKARLASSSFVLLLCALGLGLVLVGCDGKDGKAGAPGASGPAGPAGAVGAAGPAGSAGSAGARGPAGSAGPAGPAGAAGATGPEGSAGQTGTPGVSGALGSGTVTAGSTLIQGRAIKGPIANASVFLLAFAKNQFVAGARAATCAAAGLTRSTLSPAGAAGAAGGPQEMCLIGSSGTTDANGTFALTIPSALTAAPGPAVVQVTNGTFVDEATGASVTGPLGSGINTTLRAIIAVDFLDDLRVPGGGGTIVPVAVTALTEMATARAMGQGTAPTPGEAHSANGQLAGLFGLADVNIVHTIPSDILDANSSGDTDEAKRYGLINAGFSQLAQVLEGDKDVLDVVGAAATDYSDGILNALSSAGLAVTLQGASSPLSGSALAQTFATAITTIQDSAANQTGFSVDAAVLATINDANIASNNIITLADNGCRAADNQLPSGPFMGVRSISGSVATLRNANSDAGGTFVNVGLGGGPTTDFLSGQSITIRCTFANFSQGNTALGDRGTGTFTVSPRFTIRDPLATDVGAVIGGTLAVGTTEPTAPIGTPTGTFRSITGVLSGLTVSNGPAGVTVSKPEDATVSITAMRDANNNPIILTTPLSSGSIVVGGQQVRFVPGALISELSALGVSQFDGLIRNGIFVYEISLGMNMFLHPPAGVAENNGPAAPRPVTCLGTPGTVGTAPASTTPAAFPCVPVTTLMGSIQIAQ